MARPPRLEANGAIYHVVARGNEQRDIFRDDRDRSFYLDRLGECREQYRFSLLAYCLMSNHVHLVIERGPVALARIIGKLHSSYAQRFNRRHRRVGHLFQGRYKAIVVQKDRYLLALLRYVHRNPCEAGIVVRPQDYAWSSDRFIRAARGPRWLDLERLGLLLGGQPRQAAARYVHLMNGAAATNYDDAPLFANVIRGSETFARDILARRGLATRPAIGWTPARIGRVVAGVERIPLAHVRGPGQTPAQARARAIAAFAAWHEAGISLGRMAEYLRRDVSTLAKAVQRLEVTSVLDPKVRAVVRRVRDSSTVHD